MRCTPRWTVAAMALVSTVTCGGGDKSSPSGFCEALERSDSCKGGLRECRDALAADALDHAKCVPLRDKFLGCIAEQELECPQIGTVYAGAGPSSGRGYSFQGNTAYVGRACQAAGDDWVSCTMCSSAVGYGQQGKDLGSVCQFNSDCVDPLACTFGFCTRPCRSNDDCLGRSYRDGRCTGGAGKLLQCDGLTGICLPDCSSNEECQMYERDGFCPGNGSRTTNGQGTLSRCYFGPCSDNGCEPRQPGSPGGRGGAAGSSGGSAGGGAAGSAGGGGNAPTPGLGLTCTSTSPCPAGSECLSVAMAPVGLCSARCTTDAMCSFAGPGVGVCALRVDSTTLPDYCGIACGDGNCPSGMSCQIVNAGTVMERKLCFPP